jgi:hypothetical protein
VGGAQEAATSLLCNACRRRDTQNVVRARRARMSVNV